MVSTRRHRRPAPPATPTNTTTTATTAGDVDDELHRAQTSAANNTELSANAQNAHDIIQKCRPKNTTRTYTGKQQEFLKFCNEKQFHDGSTVTQDKMLLFIVKAVLNRPLQRPDRNTAKDVPLEDTRLSWPYVKGYVTAVIDLYRAQKARGMNSHPSPEQHTIRQYVKVLRQRETERRREQFADKGWHPLRDGYDIEQRERVCESLREHTETSPERRKEQFADKGTHTLRDGYDIEQRVCESLWEHTETSPECHFRTLTDFLLSRYMLSRGCDRRGAEISDVHTFELPGEGPTRCMPLIFTTNKHGRLRTIGALRHRMPLLCVQSALAFYLLYRWDLTDEPFPDFSHREAWYNTRLITASTHGRSRGCGAAAQLGYGTQLDWIKKALEYAGIESQNKTHIGRNGAAKLAELLGAPDDQIRRAGWWNQEEMDRCYRASLPREFMRVIAGLPTLRGRFEIPRASVVPPDELLSMIWPELDTWKGRFGPGRDEIEDLAAKGFTDLLFSLREVILQDSVNLRKRFPRSPVWSHPVFQHAAYAEFTARMEGAVEVGGVDDGERPTKLTLLTQAMPELAEGLHGLKGDLRQLASIVSTVVEQVQAQSVRNAHIQHILTAASLALRIDPPDTSAGAGLAPSLAASLAAGPAANPAPDLTPDSPEQQPQPPRYTMCRSANTVERLWQEWTVGLNGQPCVSALDSRWGSRWRSGRQSELQWYSLRLEVIREIRRRAKAQGSSEEQAMWSLNLQQQQMGCSLDRLCKQLRAGRSACTRTGKGTSVEGAAAGASVEGTAAGGSVEGTAAGASVEGMAKGEWSGYLN